MEDRCTPPKHPLTGHAPFLFRQLQSSWIQECRLAPELSSAGEERAERQGRIASFHPAGGIDFSNTRHIQSDGIHLMRTLI